MSGGFVVGWASDMSCGDVRNWLAADGRDSTGAGHLRAIPPGLDAHLSWCSQCRDEVAAAARFEARLCQGLSDWIGGASDLAGRDDELAEIAVGRSRLEAVLEARLSEISPESPVVGALPEGTANVTSTPLKRPVGKRRWARRMTFAASICLLVVMLAVWWRPVSSVERVAVERATLAATARLLASNHPYQGVLPSSVDGSLLRGAVPAYVEVENRRVDVLRFAFRQRTRVIEGRLLVIPVRMLADVPPATFFMGGPLRYTDQFAASWWVEGDFAYACCLTTADESAFRALLPRPWTT